LANKKRKAPKGYSGKRKNTNAKKIGNTERTLMPVKFTRWASASKTFRDAADKNLRAYNIPTYTDQELEFFEDAWATTPAGTALDKRMEFVIGGGVKPTFELIDPIKDNGEEMTDQEQKEILQDYDDELKELEEFDEQMHFNQKLYDAAIMAKVFGRSVILFENLEDDKSIGLPKSLKLVHSRNLNKVNFDQNTWALMDVLIQNPSKKALAEEMIYLVNKPDSPIRLTLWYGYSEMQRIVGAARAYRRIIEFDMPEITQSMWASYGMFLIKRMGRSESDATIDVNTVLNSLNPGAFNAVTVDQMDEIEFIKADLDPKIKELTELGDFYERLMIGNSQTPSALLGREEDQNRATLIGKIKFFIEGPVKADREWLSNIIGSQWYERNLVKLGHEEILEHVRIKPEFETISIEQWEDLVEPVQRLITVLPNLPDDLKLQLLNLEELKDDLEEAPIQQNLDAIPQEAKVPKLPTVPVPTSTVSTAKRKKKLQYSKTAESFTFKEKASKWRGSKQYKDAAAILTFDHSSSFVGRVVYEKADKEMLIVLGDRIYNFCSVPRQIYDGFRKANSKGKFFNEAIKGIWDC